MTIYMTAAQSLLTCLEGALNARPNPPARMMLRAGEQVTPLLGQSEDECCDGLAWVRIAGVQQIRNSSDFENFGNCVGTGRRLTLEMGVVRCAPTSDVSTVPTEDQWTNAALQLDSDHDAMEAALCCLLEAFGDELGGVPTLGADGYTPTGVDGNCIGGRMTVEMEVDCGCQA
jgi:hypothetical protein